MIAILNSLFKSSLEDFRRNKIRTILTSLGILIGVLSVVILISLGLGLKNYIKNQFESLGTNLVVVVPGRILSGGGGFRGGPGALGGISFDETDVAKTKKIKEVEYAVPAVIKTITVQSGDKSEVSDLFASTPEIFIIRNLETSQGRVFNSADVENRSKKVILGPKIAEKLFGKAEDAVGKTVRIENQRFTVIGVLSPKGGGGFGGPDFDSFTYTPFTSAISFNPSKKFAAIYLRATSDLEISSLKENVKSALLKRYKEDDFSVIEQTEILNAVNSIFSVINLVLVAIGSISLLVGGIGIMNIMYATVTERTREIGIRRAVGATRNDILLQFMSEATILSLFGGILGLTIAWSLVFIVRPFFPAEINLVSVAAALGVSSLIGVFFGVFPALKAANLSPIEAIRYE